MSRVSPSVVIMARAPRRAEVRRALEPVLGPDGCVALQRVLLQQAVAWARRVAPPAVHVAHDPPDAGPELRLLLVCGNLALFRWPWVLHWRYLLFDVGGTIGIAGMAAMLLFFTARNIARLYREERIP